MQISNVRLYARGNTEVAQGVWNGRCEQRTEKAQEQGHYVRFRKMGLERSKESKRSDKVNRAYEFVLDDFGSGDPIQFGEASTQSLPELTLLWGMLELAIIDAGRGGIRTDSNNGVRAHIRYQAKLWLFGEPAEEGEGFTFAQVCEQLGVDADETRAKIKAYLKEHSGAKMKKATKSRRLNIAAKVFE